MIAEVVRLESKKVMISREIANSRFNLDVSQMSIFLCVIGKLSQSKPINKETWHTVTAEEYAKVRNVSVKAGKLALKEAMKTLYDSSFFVFDNKIGDYVEKRWVISRYGTEKEVSFQFHPDIVPFICELDNYFTAKLLEVGDFKHKMSYTLYFLIMGNRRFHTQNAGELEVDIEEFLKRTGLISTSYENYKTLRAMLLIPAIKELLNKKVFYFLEVSKERNAIKFIIKWQIKKYCKSSLS